MPEITCTHEDGSLYIRVSGFVFAFEADKIKARIFEELNAVNGHPFKVMFDLRGMRALQPSVFKDLEEIDDWLYESTAIRIGTVFDSLIARIQHMRVAERSKGRNEINSGRSKIFTNAEECKAWLKAN